MSIVLKNYQNAAAFVDNTYPYRIVDAFGSVKKHEIPLGFSNVDGDVYNIDVTGTTPTVVNSVTEGAVMDIATPAADFAGVNVQLTGESFVVDISKPLYFGARLKVDDVDTCDLLVGLATTDSALMAVDTDHAIALTGDGIFFSFLATDDDINAYTYVGDSATNSLTDVGTPLDDTYHDYEFVWDKSKVTFYFDGENVGEVTTSLPDEEITPSINFRAGSAAESSANVAWMRCIQLEDE